MPPDVEITKTTQRSERKFRQFIRLMHPIIEDKYSPYWHYQIAIIRCGRQRSPATCLRQNTLISRTLGLYIIIQK